MSEMGMLFFHRWKTQGEEKIFGVSGLSGDLGVDLVEDGLFALGGGGGSAEVRGEVLALADDLVDGR